MLLLIKYIDMHTREEEVKERTEEAITRLFLFAEASLLRSNMSSHDVTPMAYNNDVGHR